jgi:hypothetical protein
MGYLLVLSLYGEALYFNQKGLIGLTALQVVHCIVFAAIFLLLIGFKSLSKPKEKWKYIVLTSMLGTFIPAFFL